MARGPGQVEVITEVGYCPSCGRTRNLRREEHHLGQLVRTTVTCETCHRTLSSSIGVAAPESAKPETEPEAAPEPAQPAAPTTKAAPAKKTASATKPAVKKPTAKKPEAKKPAAAKKAPAKPASTATRKTTRSK